MTERIGTFHQLTVSARRDMESALRLIEALIDEQRKPTPDPEMIATLTLHYVVLVSEASQAVTTAAMHWAAVRAAKGGK